MPALEISDCAFNERGQAFFDCIVSRQEVQVTRDQSKYELSLTCEVDSGPAKGKHAWAHIWLTPKALRNSYETIKKTFGWDGGVPVPETTDQVREYLMALKGVCKMSKFVGEECSITVGVEEYNGVQRLKVAWLNPRHGGGSIDDDGWDDLLAAHGIGEGRTKEPDAESWSKSKVQPTLPDDDFPFLDLGGTILLHLKLSPRSYLAPRTPKMKRRKSDEHHQTKT